MRAKTQAKTKSLTTSGRTTWLMTDVAFPLFLIFIVFWPIASWSVPNQEFLYERYFGSGDLIAIGIVLLATKILNTAFKKDNENNILFVFSSMLLMMIGTVSYGAIKIKYLSYTFPETGKVDATITNMTNFNMWFVILTISLIFAFTGKESI